MWFVCKCPKCGYSDFEIDFEKTIEYFEGLYDLASEPVSLLNKEPPFRPDEMSMICENPKCQHKEIWSIEKLVKELRNGLSDFVWAEKKRNRPDDLFMLEDTLIQHFVDNEEIDEEQLKGNAYLRKLYHKAHGEKS